MGYGGDVSGGYRRLLRSSIVGGHCPGGTGLVVECLCFFSAIVGAPIRGFVGAFIRGYKGI